MEYSAIDLHLRHSQIRIVEADGSVVLDRRIPTSQEGFASVFGGRPRMRILLETGTESEWVAQCLEANGHEVIVADPNYALMYGARQRRVKTDQRDVAALAEACRLGIYRPAHRVSAEQRQRRRELRVREQLVRVRTQAINLLRAQLRQEGYRLPSGSAEAVGKRYAQLVVPAALHQALAPLLDLLAHLAPALKQAGEAARAQAAADPIVQRLMTAPGIGPITALTYRATVDDIHRFTDAGSASAFFGLVPQEKQLRRTPASGSDHQGGATRRAQSPDPGGVGGVAAANRGRRASRVGHPPRRSTGQAGRGRRPGAAAVADPVCNVAGWYGVPPRVGARPDLGRVGP
jgi:transposase